MKLSILAGVALLASGVTGLLAQTAAGPKPKSPDEGKAINAIITAGSDPDAVIKASEELVTKYADTEFKEFALSMEARAYQQKRDAVNAQLFGERVLQVNPHSYTMELLVAEVMESGMKEHDIDIATEVAKVTKLLNGSIDDMKAAAKPNPQLTDAQWADAQKYSIAESHNGLGVLALIQKKYDDAIKEFQVAWEGDPEQDAYGTRLASAYLSSGEGAKASEICDKLLAKPNLNPQIKVVVTNIKNAAAPKK